MAIIEPKAHILNQISLTLADKVKLFYPLSQRIMANEPLGKYEEAIASGDVTGWTSPTRSDKYHGHARRVFHCIRDKR